MQRKEGVCEHGRQKRRSKECRGSGICEHVVRAETLLQRVRRRSNMNMVSKEILQRSSAGSGICEHEQKRRSGVTELVIYVWQAEHYCNGLEV
jgi:hypothetical protein